MLFLVMSRIGRTPEILDIGPARIEADSGAERQRRMLRQPLWSIEIRERQLRRGNGAAFTDDRRPLEGVAQFTHVAWPGVG